MFTRIEQSSDTFGMMTRAASKVRARARGTAPAETGRHAGGPCPAVCLATLTGWSYARAAEYLRVKVGFVGRGLVVTDIAHAFDDLLGEGTPIFHGGRTVAEVCRALPAGFCGYVCDKHHIMPVLRGRLLNATAENLRNPAVQIRQYHIV